jgi:hypothetical protein
VSRAVPRALFGERSLGGPGTDYTGNNATPLHITSMAGHDALIVGAWVIVAIVIALAVTRFTDPNWTLAGVAALFSVGVFFEELFINTDVVQPRYTVAPALLLYAALVALLRPRSARPMAKTAIVSGAQTADLSRGDDPSYPPEREREGAVRVRAAVRWLPAAGFAVLLAVAVLLNFRATNGRTTSPPWTQVVATARSDCALPGVSAYTYVHEWWSVTIPCSKVG